MYHHQLPAMTSSVIHVLWLDLKCYKALRQNVPTGIKKKLQNFSQDRQSPGQNFKSRLLKYEALVLSIWPWCPVFAVRPLDLFRNTFLKIYKTYYNNSSMNMIKTMSPVMLRILLHICILQYVTLPTEITKNKHNLLHLCFKSIFPRF